MQAPASAFLHYHYLVGAFHEAPADRTIARLWGAPAPDPVGARLSISEVPPNLADAFVGAHHGALALDPVGARFFISGVRPQGSRDCTFMRRAREKQSTGGRTMVRPYKPRAFRHCET